MSRSCYIEKIRLDIKETIGVDKTSSAKAIKENKILLPFTDKHKTKDSTLEWAKRLQKEINTKYNSKAFGSLIEIDNTVSNGTILDITIPSKLIDAYEKKYGEQKSMFSLDTVFKKNELIDKIEAGLEEYIKNNNIKVEFLDSLKQEFKEDPIAVFDTFKNLIRINQNKADLSTLREELGHHLTIALGNNNLLVNRSLNLINKIGIKELLGEEYEAYNISYDGNKETLKKEILGKLISKALGNDTKLPNELNSETGIKLWDTIKRIIDRFISLFKPNDNIFNELQKNVEELSDIIKSGKKIEFNSKFDSKPMFSLDKKYEAKEDIKKQYLYYKGVITKNKKQIAKFKKLIETDPKADKNLLNGNISFLQEQIVKITKALDELEASNNKQLIINLAEDTLKYAEDYVKKLNDLQTPTINDDSINHIRETIDVLSKFSPTSKRAIDLYNDGLKPLIKKYALYNVGEATSNPNITEEELDKDIKDIFVGEKVFGTLSDVSNKLGKTIGYLIKKAQAAIALENKDSYKKINTEVEELLKYSKSKGIDNKDTYKVFIQQLNGKNKEGKTWNTAVLTKPYTTEFYDKLNTTFEDKVTGLSKRKVFAIWDSTEEIWRPKDRTLYENSNYNEIQKSKELKRFYDFFKKTIEDASDKLPISLNKNFIPNVVEESLLSIIKSDQTVKDKLKDSVSYLTDIYDISEELSNNVFDESLYPDTVPLKYIAKVEVDKKSNDLGSSLLKFMYFVNTYEHMTETLPKVNLLLDEIKNKTHLKNTNNNTKIAGTDTNIFKMAEEFKNMQVLGKMKKEEAMGKLQYGKLIDFGLKYTSLLRIGFNPFNAFTNVSIGRIGNVIEARGGRYFNMSQYYKAEGIFFTQIGFKESKVNKLIEKFNPLMELEDYENLEKIGISYLGSQKYKEKLKSGAYFLQTTGEKYLQTTTMIANLLHDTIKDKNGKEVPIWEAFDENGEWKDKEFGELTEEQLFKRTNKIQRINQSIHGRYSAKDSAIWNQYAIFRMFFQFKKWMPSAFEQRLQSKRFDDRLGYEIEGRWLTYYKALKLTINTLKMDSKGIEANKFTETDIYNMKRNITELVTLTAVILTAFGLKGLGDDDKDLKKQGWFKFCMMQLDRISGDILYFYNSAQVNRTITTGLPLMKTIDDLNDVITALPHAFGMENNLYGKDEKNEFKSGPRKGESHFWGEFKEIIPGVKPTTDVIRLFNNNPYKVPTPR